MQKFLAAFVLLVTASTSFGTLADLAGTYKGTTLTTFTESTPPTYTEVVTVKVVSKGAGNAGTVLLSSTSTVPGNATMTIAVKMKRNGSGSAIVNNSGANVSNLTIPWNAKIKKAKLGVTSEFALFGMFPTSISMTMKVRGKKMTGTITFVRLDTGAQVVTSNFVVKKKK